jgi:Asp-tRNA(Asn)/Glu-tRNA(Gln) amidotransferase A subunit family amidase
VTELTALSVTELAPLLRERQLSPVELTEAHLARIERLDGQINSYIRVMPDAARAAARTAEAEIGRGEWRGPVHGVPLGIKDLFDVAGVPNTLGSRILRDNVPAADATVVQRLKQAGAVILGKHNLQSARVRLRHHE